VLCVRKHKSVVCEEAQECCVFSGRKHKSVVCVLGGSTRVLCVRKHKSAVCEEAQECCV